MEKQWHEKQDEIEAAGGRIDYRDDGGAMLVCASGFAVPLCSSWTIEAQVNQAYNTFTLYRERGWW